MLLGFRPLKEYLFMFFKTSFQRNFSLQGAMLISNTINHVYSFSGLTSISIQMAMVYSRNLQKKSPLGQKEYA